MAPYAETSRYSCRNCGKATWHSRGVTPINHILHLLISVLLCGLWLPVWLIIAICGPEKTGWRCDECGSMH